MSSDVGEVTEGLENELCNGKLPHLLIPSKTATLIPEFAVEDLPSTELQPWFLRFAVKDLPLGRTLMMMMNAYVT